MGREGARACAFGFASVPVRGQTDGTRLHRAPPVSWSLARTRCKNCWRRFSLVFTFELLPRVCFHSGHLRSHQPRSRCSLEACGCARRGCPVQPGAAQVAGQLGTRTQGGPRQLEEGCGPCRGWRPRARSAAGSSEPGPRPKRPSCLLAGARAVLPAPVSPCACQLCFLTLRQRWSRARCGQSGLCPRHVAE